MVATCLSLRCVYGVDREKGQLEKKVPNCNSYHVHITVGMRTGDLTGRTKAQAKCQYCSQVSDGPYKEERHSWALLAAFAVGLFCFLEALTSPLLFLLPEASIPSSLGHPCLLI